MRKKAAQAGAIGGGAFREHQYRVPLLQAAGNFLGLANRLTTAALDKQGPHGPGQCADQRPVTHLRLGEKIQMPLAGNHRNIQPRHMVADQKHGGFHPAPRDRQLHPEDTQKMPAPTLFRRQHHRPIRRPERPQQERQHKTPQQIEHNADHPPHSAQLRPEPALGIRANAGAMIHLAHLSRPLAVNCPRCIANRLYTAWAGCMKCCT